MDSLWNDEGLQLWFAVMVVLVTTASALYILGCAWRLLCVVWRIFLVVSEALGEIITRTLAARSVRRPLPDVHVPEDAQP